MSVPLHFFRSIGSVCDSDTKKIFDVVFNELLRGTGNTSNDKIAGNGGF